MISFNCVLVKLKLVPGLRQHAYIPYQAANELVMVAEREQAMDCQNLSQFGRAVLAGSLMWDPSKRLEAAKLLRLVEMDDKGDDKGDGAPGAETRGKKRTRFPRELLEQASKQPPLAMTPSHAGADGEPEMAQPCLQFLTQAPAIKQAEMVAGKCECSGHCYTPGHRWNATKTSGGKACNSERILHGTKYCLQCQCSIPGCGSPRLRGRECCRHGKVLANLPLQMRMVYEAKETLAEMVPCDIQDFVCCFTTHCHDIVLSVLMSLLTESSAIQTFRNKIVSLTADYSIADLAVCLSEVAMAVDNAPKCIELEQTGPQCVAWKERQGVANLLQFLGIIEPIGRHSYGRSSRSKTGIRARASTQGTPLADPEAVWTFGLTDQYAFTQNNEMLAKFVSQCHNQAAAWAKAQTNTTFISYVQEVSALLKGIVSDNCFGSVVQKLIIARIANNTLTVDWASHSLADLRLVDQSKYLGHVPDTWNVAQIADFFLGRSDGPWPMLLSTFVCQWEEPCCMWPDMAKDMQSLVHQDAFKCVVKNFKASHGLLPHPMPMLALKACVPFSQNLVPTRKTGSSDGAGHSDSSARKQRRHSNKLKGKQ